MPKVTIRAILFQSLFMTGKTLIHYIKRGFINLGSMLTSVKFIILIGIWDHK